MNNIQAQIDAKNQEIQNLGAWFMDNELPGLNQDWLNNKTRLNQLTEERDELIRQQINEAKQKSSPLLPVMRMADIPAYPRGHYGNVEL